MITAFRHWRRASSGDASAVERLDSSGNAPSGRWARLRAGGLGALLTRGASATATVRALGQALGLGAEVLAARLLGAEAFGDYVYVYAWVGVLVLFAKMGMDTASVRFVAEYRERGQPERLRGFLRFAGAFSVGAGLVAAAFLAGAAALAAERLRALFWIGCAALPLLGLLQVRSEQLRGLRRMAQSLAPEVLLVPVLFATGLVVLHTTGRRLGALDAMLVECGALAAALLLASFLLRRAAGPETRGSRASYRAREWLAVAVPLVALSGLHRLIVQADVVVVGLLLDPAQAGAYRVASRISHLVPFFLTAVNAIAAPLIVSLYTQGRHAELQRMLRLAAGGIAVLSVPVALATALFAEQLLGLFGPAFPAARPALVILVVGQLANVLAGPVATLLVMTGHERRLLPIIAWSVLANLVLDLALVPLLGITGAAVATALAVVAWNAAYVVLSLRWLDLDPTPFRLRRRSVPGTNP